jgi:hypothetical protein
LPFKLASPLSPGHTPHPLRPLLATLVPEAAYPLKITRHVSRVLPVSAACSPMPVRTNACITSHQVPTPRLRHRCVCRARQVTAVFVT